MRRVMMMAAILPLLAMARPTAAQEPCTDAMTVNECVEHVRSQALGSVGDNVAAQTAAKPAGEADGAQAAHSIDDFLPRLAAAAITPGLDTGLVARLSTNIPWLNSEHLNYVPVAVRLGAELRAPDVYGPMLDSVAETRRSAVRDRLKGDLGELSDPELTVGVNIENRRLGRRWEAHSTALALVASGHVPAQRNAKAQAALNAFLIVRTDLPGCAAAADNGDREAPISCFAPGDRDQIRKLAADVGNTLVEYEQGFDAWAEDSGWKYIPDLLNNQPQLSFHFGWRPREHAVGPETWGARARYERGLINLNSVRSHCANVVRRGLSMNEGLTPSGEFQPECFGSYMRSRANLALLKMGVRWFMEGNVTRERAFRAPFVETDSAEFTLPSAWRLGLTGGIGGFLPTRSDVQGSRVDLAFTGEWAMTEDALRPDKRLTVSLGLTQRLTDSFSLLSGLVWSDRGEFEGDDVTPVRLRLGVRYKLIPTTGG